jgi:flap endonuclease-1
MGVQIQPLIQAKEIDFTCLSGKIIGIDAYNALYQFISIIRQRPTGEFLRDSKGRITSHLSGLFYRTINLLEYNIKPVYVFDGVPPEFKTSTINSRKKIREEAEKKWKESIERGDMEEAFIHAQAAVTVTDEMIEESKLLLKYMGIPVVEAKSEGEAQLAFMCKKGDIWASASQDYDALLFGSPRLIRNLSISGKRKLPRKEIYVEIKPELIELEELLKQYEITREQLIIIGMLIGTDYNPGVHRVGPKTALKLVSQYRTLEEVIKHVSWECDIDLNEIYNFFLSPPVNNNYEIKWEPMQKDKIIKLMVDEHDFSKERIENALNKVERILDEAKQKTLSEWLK